MIKLEKLEKGEFFEDAFLVSYRYNKDYLNKMRSLKYKRYVPDKKAWEIPSSELKHLVDLFGIDDINVNAKYLEGLVEKEESKAEEAPEDIKERLKDIKPIVDYPFKTKPFPHQIEAFNRGYECKNLLLADDQGLGKTKESIDIAVARKDEIGKCLIVCGVNSVKYNWKKEVSVHSNESCVVIDGKTVDKRIQQIDQWLYGSPYFGIINIESLRNEKIMDRIYVDCKDDIIGAVIVDEIHKGEIAADLKSADWSKYQLKKISAKAKTIVKIISSATGKEVQDSLVREQMEKYVTEAEKLGVTDQAALMMCANFRHQGGLSAVKRVLGKTEKPYTLDHIYSACCTDTGNQVGAYKSRQKFVYTTLKSKVNSNVKEETKMGVTAQQIIDIMDSWVGLSRAKGTHKPIIDLYNSHKPLARSYAVGYNDSYCDTTVSAAFIKAGAVDLIGGTECGVEEHVKLFKKAGIWIEDGTITPEKGDIVVFNWDDATQPNDGYSDHIGVVRSVGFKNFETTEGNMSGGVVGHRTVAIGWGYIRGFARPKYAKAKTLHLSRKNQIQGQIRSLQRLLQQLKLIL